MFEIILKSIIFIAVLVVAILYYRKHKNEKYNILRVLFAVLLLTMVLSYLIPGKNYSSYTGKLESGYAPISISDMFLNGITAMNVSLVTIAYLFAVSLFYVVLKKTNKYEVIVNNVAATFKKNKSLFIVLTVFVLGLTSLFTGQLFIMIVFIPFLISVIRKLGYSKEIAITTTIGSVLLGNAGTLNAYSNSLLSLSVKDNVATKIVVAIVALVCLLGFILVFSSKPVSTKELTKTKEKKVLPIYIAFIVIFVLLILGFVSWNSYFGFEGFKDLLTSIRKVSIGKVSIFDALIGSQNIITPFGEWALNNASVLLLFVTIIMVIVYKVRLLDSVAEAAKKALPYAGILVLSNLVLVNIVQSGLFYQVQMLFTTKSVNLFNSSVSSLFSSMTISDLTFATSFTLEAIIRNTKALDFENLLSIVFQTVYSLGLIVSPVSVLALFGLNYTETSYKDWFKHIWKFFLIMLVALLVVIKVLIDGFTLGSIIAFVLLIVGLALLAFLKVKNIENSTKKVTKKEEVKVTKIEEKKDEPVKEEKKESKKDSKNKSNKKKK